MKQTFDAISIQSFLLEYNEHNTTNKSSEIKNIFKITVIHTLHLRHSQTSLPWSPILETRLMGQFLTMKRTFEAKHIQSLSLECEKRYKITCSWMYIGSVVRNWLLSAVFCKDCMHLFSEKRLFETPSKIDFQAGPSNFYSNFVVFRYYLFRLL